MSFPLHAATILFSGALRLGPLLVSVYGLFAAIGLIAALMLTERTAVLAGLMPGQLWNASLFAVTAAFVVSRVLLIVRDPHAFMTVPLVVLALPSFTYSGMALTALAVVVYLRGKRLGLLSVLDAWAPCAALLAVFLSLGHFFEGTDQGMPTSLPWGSVVPGSGGLLHLQPVQIYAAVAALVLFVVLLWMLERRGRPGVVEGTGLLVGGAVAFGLDMLSQPIAGEGVWLERGQWVALGAMVVGVVMVLGVEKKPIPYGNDGKKGNGKDNGKNGKNDDKSKMKG